MKERQPEETSRTCWKCGQSRREEWFNNDGLCLDCVKAKRVTDSPLEEHRP